MPKIAVAELEYVEGGNAIWIHSPKAVTVMRIQCTGQIKTCAIPLHSSSHMADLNVVGNITILKHKQAKRKKLKIK